MATAATVTLSTAQQWHPGERAVHRLLRVPEDRGNPTHPGLAPSHGQRIARAPLVALGALDGRGRPWAALWGGERGCCRPVADGVLGLRGAALDVAFDPVLREVLGVPRGDGSEGGERRRNRKRRGKEIVSDEVVRPDADRGGKLVAALAIDLETRDRVKFAGRALAGAVTVRTLPSPSPSTPSTTEEQQQEQKQQHVVELGDLQMAIRVEETLGNCPKYLNRKRITPHVPSPRLVSPVGDDGRREGREQGGAEESDGGGSAGLLSREAADLVERADLFFIASRYGDEGGDGGGSMDVNHRGGAPGFVRVLRRADGGAAALVYPEYSGNRLYQTLGNLHADPRAGLAVPDFATSDVLYATGRASILVGADAAAACSSRRVKLAVRIDVEEARFVRDGLPFRGQEIDYSPYNPPVPQRQRQRQRQRMEDEDEAVAGLGNEIDGSGGGGSSGAVATATLLHRQTITPSIARYVFKLTTASGSADVAWQPGQHVTLDFGPELDVGWEHMRDDDPQSLNDDFVRTFTVSSSGSGSGGGDAQRPSPAEFEITVRRNGSATGLLARWNTRVPLELPVLGFGGAEEFRLPVPGPGEAASTEKESVFVAAGVGITPLMAQAAAAVLQGGRGLRVLWSLRREDLPLAVHVFERIEGLGKVTKLFVTGGGRVEDDGVAVGKIWGLGLELTERRMGAEDVLAAGEKGRRKYYCCTAPEMMKALLQWTEGEEVVFESFNY